MRPSWTNVLIDGMDVNDPVFGYSPAGASGFFLGWMISWKYVSRLRLLAASTVQIPVGHRAITNQAATTSMDRFLNCSGPALEARNYST